MSPEVTSKLRPQPSRFFSKTGLISTCLIGVALVVILRSAWVSDDAYITFRVVDNLWHGYGPRWNISERVCVYTNPLMMLSMAVLYPFTHEFFSLQFPLDVPVKTTKGVERRLAYLKNPEGLELISGTRAEFPFPFDVAESEGLVEFML